MGLEIAAISKKTASRDRRGASAIHPAKDISSEERDKRIYTPPGRRRAHQHVVTAMLAIQSKQRYRDSNHEGQQQKRSRSGHEWGSPNAELELGMDISVHVLFAHVIHLVS